MNFRHKRFLSIVVSLFALACASPAWAGRGTTPQGIPGLGTVTFPTSAASDAAQTEFIRGLLLLHLFEYPDAAKAFRDAESLDPGFAMAYWGEAMTYNHGIWNQLDEAAGREALAKLGPTRQARAAKAPTAREKAYLAAVEILYSGADTKPERDARYCEAMRKLAAAWPRDNNAQLFYALALMGRHEGVRDVPDYLQAAAIAERVFRSNPDNPGAAHYWIHGMDEPRHAAGALEAARALAKVSPDAGHAQHMTSHVFMALGMWDDVINANVNAVRVVNLQRRAAGKPDAACGHYNEWLEYAYFQRGDAGRGEKMLEECARSIPIDLAWAGRHAEALAATRESVADISRALRGSLLRMRAYAVVESRDWNGSAVKLPIDVADLGPSAGWNDLVLGFAAAERGDLGQAAQSSARLHALRAGTTSFPPDPQVPDYLAVMDDGLRGVILIRQGHANEGLAAIRGAADRYDATAFDFGPPMPLKPPHELLGEELLALGRAADAIPEFEAALKKAPKRRLAEDGLSRARHEAGEKARKTTPVD